MKALQRAQFVHVRFQKFFVLLLRFVIGLHHGRPFFESELFSGLTRNSLESIFIFTPRLLLPSLDEIRLYGRQARLGAGFGCPGKSL
jgi:hypothetical protein